MAFTSDSHRFTLPPGTVSYYAHTAWRTNSPLCSASSIQAMTDTSLVGRVLAIFGRGLGIQLYGHLELLTRPTQNIDQKITQDNFHSHTKFLWTAVKLSSGFTPGAIHDM